jgi:hypothetical protein
MKLENLHIIAKYFCFLLPTWLAMNDKYSGLSFNVQLKNVKTTLYKEISSFRILIEHAIAESKNAVLSKNVLDVASLDLTI